MNDVLAGIAATAAVTWMGWISWTTIRNSERLGKLETNAATHTKDMETIKESFKEVVDKVEASNGKILERLDLFLKTEIQEFKGLTEDVVNALNKMQIKK